ncbi:MAG: hypothetical protein WC688_05365 [Parachlamydiales bacterium]|jgi:hypothetical protein
MFRVLFLVFSILSIFLHEENCEAYQSTVDALPNVLIESCVNALTGSLYINEPDTLAFGKESLVFSKRYLTIG